MKPATRCRAVDCSLFATAHVEAELEETGAVFGFDACADHALGCLNLAPLLGLVVRLSELPCAYCRRPLFEGPRAERDDPLHAGACELAYDAKLGPS
jgi:hypothetical protein